MHVALDRCPYCGEAVVVRGDDVEGTHYHWCPACRCAVDPAPADTPPEDGTPELGSPDEHPDLGSCCICEGVEGVRNGVMLNKKSPIPGHGWGCLVCRMPADGASAVLCDGCFEAFKEGKAKLKWACRGYPAIDGRIPIEEPTEPFDHDAQFHEKEREAVDLRWFHDSPEEGDPDCVCSYCRQIIGLPPPCGNGDPIGGMDCDDDEEHSEIAVQLWEGEGKSWLEARFHPACFDELLGLGAFKLSGSGVSGG